MDGRPASDDPDHRSDLMQRLSSSTSASRPDLPMSRGAPYRAFIPDAGGKRGGIPPAHPQIPPLSPYSLQISPTSFGAHHSRSLSQPAFFSLDSLPPFPSSDPNPGSDPPPPPARTPNSASPSGSGRAGDGLPPRKSHRRSQSDIPFGFLQSPPGPGSRPPVKKESEWDRDSGEGRKSDADAGVDDLFSAYMNLDSLDTLNSSEDPPDSRASGTKADSSENEAESSSFNESGCNSSERKEGNKRRAAGDPLPGHCRSLSIDSFMGKLNFGEDSPRLPPSPANQVGQHSRSGSMDGSLNSFSLEFGNGEFSAAEIKKIMANDKLAEIAVTDPKRAKRILANRQSAARSKERKMRYISELEHKVQTLQTEATTLSAQLTMLQRDSAGLTSQNNELKFRLQSMEQQAQLRDALNEALTAEVQRLKLATSELSEAHLSNNLNQQIQINPQMFQLQQLQKQQQQQQQQSSQASLYQMQAQQQQNNSSIKNESSK